MEIDGIRHQPGRVVHMVRLLVGKASPVSPGGNTLMQATDGR